MSLHVLEEREEYVYFESYTFSTPVGRCLLERIGSWSISAQNEI